MSLDITLTETGHGMRRGTGVFVCEGGQNRELTAAEVRERWPDSHITEEEWETDDVFDTNITHNLTKMADEAGVYTAMWRPEEAGFTTAGDLVEPLSAGLLRLLDDPNHFRAFNPSNGWGDYDGLVETVRAYLKACVEHPDATIHVSR